LKKLFEFILAIGNFVNAGGIRGNAKGFQLDSLSKLKDTKASDNRTTLVDYIVKVAIKSHPEIMNWTRDLPHLSLAARANLQVMQKSLARIKSGLNQVVKELTSCKDPPEGDNFVHVMTAFVEANKEKVEGLEKDFETMNHEFEDAVKLFGERLESASPESFFGKFAKFAADFSKSHTEILRKEQMEAQKALRASGGGGGGAKPLSVSASAGAHHNPQGPQGPQGQLRKGGSRPLAQTSMVPRNAGGGDAKGKGGPPPLQRRPSMNYTEVVGALQQGGFAALRNQRQGAAKPSDLKKTHGWTPGITLGRL